MASTVLLEAATSTGAGDSASITAADPSALPYNISFYGKGNTSSGSGAATISIEVCNDGNGPWLSAGTISLTLGTTETADGFVMSFAWEYYRANVTAISGTGAEVTVIMGV